MRYRITAIIWSLSRLKAALRRCDIRDADDFDELEYQDASKAVGQHTYALVKVGLNQQTLSLQSR